MNEYTKTNNHLKLNESLQMRDDKFSFTWHLELSR